MTFDIETDAPERVRYEAEQLHKLAVNHFGYDTEHVLFTAHADGTISDRIALHVVGTITTTNMTTKTTAPAPMPTTR